jgi:hypothetical protein
MKLKVTLSLLACAAIALSGCNTVNKENIDAGAGWADKFYDQPNTASVLVIENTNTNQVAEFTAKNFTRFELSTPVPVKSVIPRDPEWYDGLYDTLKTVAPYAFMGWIFTDGGFGSRTTSTVNNNYAQ